MLQVLLMFGGIILQAFLVVVILYITYLIPALLFNWTRMFLYYKFGWDWLTNDEKIRFKMIKKPIEPEVCIDYMGYEDQDYNTYKEHTENQDDSEGYPTDKSTDDNFWEDMQTRQDFISMEIKQAMNNPDELLFQGKIKKRRR